MSERSDRTALPDSGSSRILVVAATARELGALRRRLAVPEASVGANDPAAAEATAKSVASRPSAARDVLFRARVGAHEVIAAPTGVGKCNASIATLDLLRQRSYRLVINTGCAGGFRQAGVRLGDVVIADEAVFGDEGTTSDDGFLDLEALALPLDRTGGDRPVYNRLPTDAETISRWSAPPDLAFEVRTGSIATVSTGSGTTRRAEEMWNRWKPLAEAMEGAAVALAARRCGCPFVEIRGISNFVGPRDRDAWEVDLACAHAAQVIEDLIRTV